MEPAHYFNLSYLGNMFLKFTLFGLTNFWLRPININVKSTSVNNLHER